jgi:hypothetical protein
MLLDEGEFGAAERALQPLLERHGKAAQVLRLRHRLLASQSRWDELVALLPALRRHKVFAEAHLAEMEAELAARRLAQPMVTLADAQEIWRALSKPAREQSAVLLLDLVLDEAEGHAFLKSRPDPDEASGTPRLPRLVARRHHGARAQQPTACRAAPSRANRPRILEYRK